MARSLEFEAQFKVLEEMFKQDISHLTSDEQDEHNRKLSGLNIHLNRLLNTFASYKLNKGIYDEIGGLDDIQFEYEICDRIEYYYTAASIGVLPIRTSGLTYIVYIVVDTLSKELVYVGSGLSNRYKHTYSGTSHNKELNRLYFAGAPVQTMIFKDELSKKDSLQLEKELIKFFNPFANMVGKESVEFYSSSYEKFVAESDVEDYVCGVRPNLTDANYFSKEAWLKRSKSNELKWNETQAYKEAKQKAAESEIHKLHFELLERDAKIHYNLTKDNKV